MSETEGFYYNLSTGAVEEGRQSPGSELMGPYQTRAEAERALQIAATRNEAWEEADEEWQDWGAPAAEEQPAAEAPAEQPAGPIPGGAIGSGHSKECSGPG